MFGSAPIFINPEDNKFEYHDDYASVMQFISKNKVIPARLAEIAGSAEHLAHVATLKSVIAAGDLNHEIFANQDCQLYVLYLLKEKQIDITHFLSLNMYLNVLSQHTDKQPLKQQDLDLRILTEVTAVSVLDEFDEFYDHLAGRFFCRKGVRSIKKDDLRAELEKLSPLGQRVLKIKDYHHPDAVVTSAKEEGLRSQPFMYRHGGYIYTHLAGVCQVMLNLINPQLSVRMAPVYGRVNLTTLFKMHQKGFHPVSLYSVFVASNTDSIHGARVGLLLSFMHDVNYHVVWGNLITHENYAFLYHSIMPAIESLFGNMFHSVREDFESNQTLATKPSALLDLLFVESLQYGDDTPLDILHHGMRCAVSDSFTRMVELYKFLLPKKEEILARFGVDITRLFMDTRMLTKLEGDRKAIFDFADEVEASLTEGESECHHQNMVL